MKSPSPKLHPDQFNPYIYPIKNRQRLVVPSDRLNKDFIETIMNRRSLKDFQGLSLSDISTLLYWCNKINSFHIDETGYILSRRTVPSGGARHPVDILISLPKERRTLSYYNPIDHSLSDLLIMDKEFQLFLDEVSKNFSVNNAGILWFSIQHEKTSSKYYNPESLYWKDTGALLYCIQIISTYLGLKSCPVGTLATDSFNKLFKSSRLISGGGILIGK